LQGGPRRFSQSSTSSDLLDRRRLPDAYGTVTFCGCPFQSIRLSLPRRMVRDHGLIRFRSPLLTESRLVSFPPGTEMCQFPGFAPHGLCIQPPVTPSGCPVAPGCPIRRSPDQRVFGRSPELIAACNVLHRLCTPRHPPRTLSSLTTFMNSCDQTTPTVLIPTHPPMNLSKSTTCCRRPAGTHRCPGAYAPHLAANGADRARTGNLRVANAALSRLSYGPETSRLGHA
jgi:hypothetical protein